MLLSLTAFTYFWGLFLDVHEYELSFADLPEAFDGFRIAQVSDLHGKQFGWDNEKLVETIKEKNVQLIAVTGDLVENAGQIGDVTELLSRLTEIAPVCYVTGNHEWAGGARRLMKSLAASGVEVLENKYRLFTLAGQSIVVAGVGDPDGPGDWKAAKGLVGEIDEAHPGLFKLVLYHRNDRLGDFGALGVQLVLSGHAHGGLIRLPFTDGLIDSTGRFFPGFTSGPYIQGDAVMVVSRGLGDAIPGLRLFNRPHLPIITLRRSA